jgi:hypothetical protein
MRTPLFLAATLLSTFAAGIASAQPLPQKGGVAIALERGFGFTTTHTEIDGQDDDRDVTQFGLMWMRSETAFHQPRAAVDFFVTDGLSLGGALGFYSWGGDGDRSGFLLYPRVGYAVGLGHSVTLWPRGGLSYYSEEEAGGNPKYTQLAISAECQFLLWPTRSWAIMLGPTLDLGVSGEISGGPNDTDFSQRSIGVTFGLLGAL